MDRFIERTLKITFAVSVSYCYVPVFYAFYLFFCRFLIFFTLDHYSVAYFLFYFTFIPFHFVSFHQARKLYRSMVVEKKRNQAATIIAAYYTGWKVIEI